LENPVTNLYLNYFRSVTVLICNGENIVFHQSNTSKIDPVRNPIIGNPIQLLSPLLSLIYSILIQPLIANNLIYNTNCNGESNGLTEVPIPEISNGVSFLTGLAVGVALKVGEGLRPFGERKRQKKAPVLGSTGVGGLNRCQRISAVNGFL
jgi:hypothetical protein